VERDDQNVVGARRNLAELDWETIQTREMEGKNTAGMSVHEFDVVEEGLLTDEIEKVQCSDHSCMYNCKVLPLVVYILHTDTMKSYNMTGSVINALQTYQTIVAWKSSVV
jgi:hypothetical protein